MTNMSRVTFIYVGALLFCLAVWAAVYVALGGALPR
jgi:hypothetical protein